MPTFTEGGRGSRGKFFNVVHSPDAVKVFHEPHTIMQKQILNNSPRQKNTIESLKKAYLQQREQISLITSLLNVRQRI